MLGIATLLTLLVLQQARAEAKIEPSVHESTTSTPPCDASTFTSPIIDGVTILSLSATPQKNYTTPTLDFSPAFTNLNFCEVNIHLTHSGADDDVLVRVWLPERNDWNGRFQATGGGGFATSMGFVGLAPAIQQGYAAVSTDGGHDEWSWTSLEWVLKPDRTVNWDLWQNFIERSVVEQILIGKNIVEQYYEGESYRSYWNGCSQGGRQGYMLAQRYPDLLDGIMAAAPALNVVPISIGGFWPQLVMKEADTYISNCEWSYFTKKTMEECDMLDGFDDGVLMDPDECNFDPGSLVGNKFVCDGQTVSVTGSMAEVVRKIRDGPRSPLGAKIWYGLTPGANHATLANITISSDGVRRQYPVAEALLGSLLLPPGFNVSTITSTDYFALWAQASMEWSWTMATNSPNLTALRNIGTKLLTWHGIDDDIIPHQSTLDYRKRVQRQMGGADEVDKFYRVFLAPGVGHCALGLGPMPTDPLAALVGWVEKGEAPETIHAATTNSKGEPVTRQLCKWPAKAKYTGTGDPKKAESWTCVKGSKRAESVYKSDAQGMVRDEL